MGARRRRKRSRSAGRHFRQWLVHMHRMVKNALEIGGMAEAWLQFRSISDRTGKPLIVRLYRACIDIAPDRRFDVLSDGTAQARPGGRVQDFKRALVAMDAQAQFIQVSRRPPACMDDAKRPIGIFRHHDETVVGIQHIFTDMVVLCLLEVLRCAEARSTSLPMA